MDFLDAVNEKHFRNGICLTFMMEQEWYSCSELDAVLKVVKNGVHWASLDIFGESLH